MKIGVTVKKLRHLHAVIGIVLLILPQFAEAQIVDRDPWRQTFVSREYRPRWGQAYENFGTYDIRKYPSAVSSTSRDPVQRGNVTPVTYDQFGNFLLPGGQIYAMNWNRSKLGASDSFDEGWSGSPTNSSSVFNNLMVCSDEFSSWQTKFIIARGGAGRGVRTYFTPSTLKQTNFGGFRWDASSRKNNISIVASPGDMPIYGVHWESILGDILKVGASFVSHQRGTLSYSHQDIDGSNTYSTDNMRDYPHYLYVLISDDSPEDTGPGALVYGIEAYVNGRKQKIDFTGEFDDNQVALRGRVFRIPDLFHMKRYLGGTFTSSTNELASYYMFRSNTPQESSSVTCITNYAGRLPQQYRSDQDSWLLSLLMSDRQYMQDIFNKNSSSGQDLGLLNITKDANGVLNDPFNLWGNERKDSSANDSKDYTRYFQADSSQGVLEAAGTDVIIYEIQIVEPETVDKIRFNVLAANDYCIDIIAPLYSNRQNGTGDWYSDPTSDDWKNRWSITQKLYDGKHCAKAPGNVKDGSNQKWVNAEYNRITGMNVYGMNMELNWRGLFVRAEFNESNTFWSYPTNEKMGVGGKDEYTSQAWFVNVEKDFGGWSLGGEVFNYPKEYMEYLPTIDDNDDDDRYTGYYVDPSNNTAYSAGDNYVRYGDADFDRYVDTTWDGQPFLEYFYDDVSVGDDFNHNGTIDSREDDSQIDLPYDRDSKGQHFFLKIRPREATIFTVGHYDIQQEYFEGRNLTQYMKFEHHQRVGGIGEFLNYTKIERIRDTMGDVGSYYNQNTDNWTWTNIISSRLTLIPNTNVTNNVRFSASYNTGSLRKTDGTEEENIRNLLSIYDGDKLIDRYGGYSTTLEHKADYTFRVADARIIPEVAFGGYRLWKEKRIKEFRLMPQIKVVHSYGHSQDSNFALQKYDTDSRTLRLYPIVRFDYQVAPKTQLRFAIQGFPGFPEMYRTRSSSYNKLYDYDKRNMVFAFENKTLYEGFNLVVLMGMRFTKQKYIHDLSKKDPGATEYFITLQSEASGG